MFMFTLFVISQVMCANRNIRLLSGNRVKYWDLCKQNNSRFFYGCSFSRKGIYDEYEIDENNKRVNVFYGDIIVNKPFRYKLVEDTICVYELKLLVGKYVIIKLTVDSLVMAEFRSGNNNFDSVMYFIKSKNQKSVPRYWFELYPNDKSKWPNGTY